MIILMPRNGIPHIWYSTASADYWLTQCSKYLPRTYSTITLATDDKYPELCTACWKHYERFLSRIKRDTRNIGNRSQIDLPYALSYRPPVSVSRPTIRSLVDPSGWRKLRNIKNTFAKRPWNKL
jgi:hypothetical protein